MDRNRPLIRRLLFGLLALAAAALPPTAAAETDASPRFAGERYAVGTYPSSAVAGDFDEDGHTDLVVTHIRSLDLSLLLGDGTGRFSSTTTITTGGYSVSAVANGDLNRDGHLDLAVAAWSGQRVLIFSGDGAGGFTLTAQQATGGLPNRIVAADLNGDGWLDLVTLSGFVYTSNVSVLMGDGAGGFLPATTLWTTGIPSDVTVADLNGDGIPDLAMPQSSDFAVYPGTGDGSFSAPLTYPVGDDPTRVRFGEFTGDDRLDAIVASTYYVDPGEWGQRVSLLAGDGNGGFSEPQTVAEITAGDFEVADLDGDGRLDLVLEHGVILADPAGGFAPPLRFPVTSEEMDRRQIIHRIPVDLNEDGLPDLVTVNPYRDSVSVLPNRAPMEPAIFFTAYPVTGTPSAMAEADFNNDGIADLAVSHYDDTADPPTEITAGAVTLLLGDGAGGFTTLAPLPVGGHPQEIVAADLNGDGIADLVSADETADELSLLLGNGDGTFATPRALPAGGQPKEVAVADVDGDTLPDLIAINYGSATVTLLRGDGAGGFTPLEPLAVNAQPIHLAVGDLDGNGYPDLILDSGQLAYLEIRYNGPAGFGAPARFPAGGPVSDLATADFDGDGHLDLAVTFDTGTDPSADATPGLRVWPGDGDRHFGDPIEFPAVQTAAALRIADLNGDGTPDMAVASPAVGEVALVLNDGTGGFAEVIHVGQTVTGAAPVVSDLNGDSRADLVTLNDGASAAAGVYPLLQRGAAGEDGTPISDSGTDSGDDACPPATVSRDLRHLVVPAVRYQVGLGGLWFRLELQRVADGGALTYALAAMEAQAAPTDDACRLATLSPAEGMVLPDVRYDAPGGSLALSVRFALEQRQQGIRFRVTGYELLAEP
ncbi:FG-GAP repeat domain-containing protein [Endothiovibrio diazotrophicus]